MRKKHLYDEHTRKTICGHRMTHQERRTARMNTLITINCKNCKKRWGRMSKYERQPGR